MAAVTTPDLTAPATPRLSGRIGAGFRAIRQLPLIPLVVLIVLLVIPAIFANQLAPHSHRIGTLDDAKLPPFWVSESYEERTVVQRADRNRLDVEIGLTNARRKIERGEAIFLTGGDDGQVNPGDTIRFQAQEGGSMNYPLGTDKQGRDILSRIMHGARVSLLVSSLAILLGGGLGTLLGMLAAYRGGKTDAVIMRIVDIKLAFPTILLALVLVAAIGAGFTTVIVVIAVLLWARYARVVRGEALAVKQQDFIDRAPSFRRVQRADHDAPHFPQFGQYGGSISHAGGGTRYNPGVNPKLPRRRHTRADPGLGRYGGRWQRPDYHSMVDLPVPLPGNCAHRTVNEPAGRLAKR